jgi:hypothetical protein
MAIDKTKIFAGSVHVYVAGRTVDTTAVDHAASTGWIDIGTMKAETTKISTDLHTVDLHDGTVQQLGVTLKLETTALETDASKITALEALITKKVDVLLKPIVASNTDVHKILACNIAVKLDGTFSFKDAITIPVSFQTIGAKVSDVFTHTTLSWSL